MKRTFFDMDGVLSKWDERMLKPVEERPIWKEGIHYFAGLEPNPQILALTRELAGHGYFLCLVSHTANDKRVSTEHLHDKQVWLREQYPDVFDDPRHVIWIPNQDMPKAAAVQLLFGKGLSKGDILIDDFNGNLTGWNKAGGTGIKYLNGFNDPDSFDGLQISHTMDVAEIMDIIEKIPPV